ncbi:Histone-lysine N-methyltransferase SUV39H2 like protein [Argiope bruennichi]|uniref:Histone-lysine N-methyltransferase n=1 Tax=Argiope bruennichi TaxID=94029 RepID=A0A8T0F9N7_ARGBR|nr:Histone-lysine N-methyltransferase SUV39H2 like protein [Argiope bruennichi]
MSLKKDSLNSFDNKHLASYRKSVKNVSVKCLQSLEDLKKSCDKLGLIFVDDSKDMRKVDLILDDKIVKNQRYYFVKWQGLSNKYNTWEPNNQLTDSEDLLSYYTSLKCPSTLLSEEMIFYFIKDLMTRKPRDILTIIKLCALIYGFDEEYISSLGLTFADLKTKLIKILDIPIGKLNKIGEKLLELMKYAEKRKFVLSGLKDWEIEINAKSPVFIKVENNVDLTGPPANFQFINNYISSYVDLTENPVVFCSCVDCYENRKECCSHNLDGSFAYNKEQHLQLAVGYPIYECNKLCKCDNNCINRVVQHGPKVKLAIFRTKNGCGWGLKTLEFITKGQFVLEYLGEIITSQHAEERGEVYDHLGRTYLFDMDWEKDCKYTVDSMLFGNASHFINHSCDPNLETYTVWINQQDPMLPRIAFFAKKKINPDEELTFDYKMIDTRGKQGIPVPEDERVLCKCNSRNCRKFLF